MFMWRGLKLNRRSTHLDVELESTIILGDVKIRIGGWFSQTQGMFITSPKFIQLLWNVIMSWGDFLE